jgi:hypothetical protein
MFVDDPEMRDDRTGQQYCFCGLPADNEVHTLQRRKEDERVVEARRIGEKS